MCLYPRLIQNKKYTPNKKNGGIIPPIKDNRVRAVPIGCGKCIECKKQKSRKWQIRLMEEIRHDTTGKFVTFSFEDKYLIELDNEINEHANRDNRIHKYTGYELENKIAKLATRRFLERWRKEHKKSVKHWLITELGEQNTERIHIHGILWTKTPKETIQKIWKYGNVITRDETNGGWVNEQTINYIVKYVNQVDEKHPNYNQIILTSPNIGKEYINRHDSKLNKFKGKDTKETYTTRKGIKINLPTYYRNQLYTDEEREQLWLNMLDKNIRYVQGEQIDISKGNKEYYKALKYHRRINKRLGYGDGDTKWKEKEYEQQRRELLQQERRGEYIPINKITKDYITTATPEEAFDLEIPF